MTILCIEVSLNSPLALYLSACATIVPPSKKIEITSACDLNFKLPGQRHPLFSPNEWNGIIHIKTSRHFCIGTEIFF